MIKTKINEKQFAIEEQIDNAMHRFTETIHGKLHEVKLNEIEIISGETSKFLWSDETSLSLIKNYYEDVNYPQISAFISELKTIFNY